MTLNGPNLLPIALLCIAVGPPPTHGRGVVASDHPLASACGAEILGMGGNAADAAVATALCAGVVQPAGSGLGGGGFALVKSSGADEATVVDFREVAPAGATRKMYLDDAGEVRDGASRKGGLAVAVPAESRGLAMIVDQFGSLPHKTVAGPAIRLAQRGFRIETHLAKALSRTQSAEVRAEFDSEKGEAPYGQRVKRPALAKTLKRWAATRGEDLHTGASAQALVAHTEARGGILTTEDLASYRVAERVPIIVSYRDHTVVTMPPPSSGGVVLAQTLRVLENHDVAAMHHNSAAYIHLLTETMKHAYADRAHHMGDPDFVDVPVKRLMSDARIDEVMQAFDPETTQPPEVYGPLIAPPQDAGTQHISVIDDQGGATVLTTTINTSFGSGLVPSSIGIVLNNEMDDFVAAPGVPNAFGLVGGEANAIAPGKRPLSSMSPTLVLDEDGKVVLAVGASGGSTIISSVLQTILNVIEFDMDPQAAVAAPRIHHQWQPDILRLEPEIPHDVRVGLKARKHLLKVGRAFSSTQAVTDGEDGPVGGSDPRKGGRPAGVPPEE